jgi:hypothetical protein
MTKATAASANAPVRYSPARASSVAVEAVSLRNEATARPPAVAANSATTIHHMRPCYRRAAAVRQEQAPGRKRPRSWVGRPARAAAARRPITASRRRKRACRIVQRGLLPLVHGSSEAGAAAGCCSARRGPGTDPVRGPELALGTRDRREWRRWWSSGGDGRGARQRAPCEGVTGVLARGVGGSRSGRVGGVGALVGVGRRVAA